MKKVTLQAEKLVTKYFCAEEKNLVMSVLADECGNNLPFCEKCSPKDLERIRFAVIRLSNGNLKCFDSAIKLAKTDWRDLLVRAEFVDDIKSHKVWANTIV